MKSAQLFGIFIISILFTSCYSYKDLADDDLYVMKESQIPADQSINDYTDYSAYKFEKENDQVNESSPVTKNYYYNTTENYYDRFYMITPRYNPFAWGPVYSINYYGRYGQGFRYYNNPYFIDPFFYSPPYINPYIYPNYPGYFYNGYAYGNFINPYGPYGSCPPPYFSPNGFGNTVVYNNVNVNYNSNQFVKPIGNSPTGSYHKSAIAKNTTVKPKSSNKSISSSPVNSRRRVYESNEVAHNNTNISNRQQGNKTTYRSVNSNSNSGNRPVSSPARTTYTPSSNAENRSNRQSSTPNATRVNKNQSVNRNVSKPSNNTYQRRTTSPSPRTNSPARNNNNYRTPSSNYNMNTPRRSTPSKARPQQRSTPSNNSGGSRPANRSFNRGF